EQTTKALSPLAGSANLVQTYAKRILNDERAVQFHTQISIMAKKDPKIANLNPDSLVTAMLACIHLDLMPNTPEQLAHVIPYGNQAQFQIGYKGLLRLAYRSGQIRRVNAEVVYEGDDFSYELGLN
ncbi:recombinase RecT, partial [Klebsiella pneumoniae]|uniref:recombinase RecT n=1 Tax=Klebsiella pneumoniae TaxID=573 RepID=UPI001E2EFB89